VKPELLPDCEVLKSFCRPKYDRGPERAEIAVGVPSGPAEQHDALFGTQYDLGSDSHGRTRATLRISRLTRELCRLSLVVKVPETSGLKTSNRVGTNMSAARASRRPKSAKPSPKGPSEVAPGVYVGGWNDAVRFAGSRFCVLDEAPPGMPPATHVQIYDEAGDRPLVRNLDRLVDEMHAARTKNEPVLVFCGHGVRRSPLAAAWYLHRVEKLSLDAAYDRVRAARPKVEHVRDWVGTLTDLD
jgi:Dual specificity phosphatase, catalytic domain